MRFLRIALASWLALLPVIASAGAPPIPPLPAAVTFRGGPILACVGDSECVQGQVSNPPTSLYYATGSSWQTGTNANSIIGWLSVASGGGFVVDFVNQAYPGNYGGLYYVRFLTQGLGCPTNTTVTITPSAPTGSPVNNAATLTFVTDASGATPVAGTTIYEPNATAQGSGYIANPSFTINQTCTTPPTFGYAITGAGSWGVNGETTSNWLWRIRGEVCGAKPDWALLVIATNDITSGSNSEAQINANVLAGLVSLEACGIRPVLFGILPRVIGVGGWTQAMDQERLRINAWRRNLALLTQGGNISSATGLTNYPGLPYPVLYVDVDHFWNDPSQTGATAGNPVFNYTMDGLHQSTLGAFTEALAAWSQIRTFVPVAGPHNPNTQNDVYSATNNPGGNILGTVGLFAGTTGTATAPCTSSSGLATGWQILESGNAAMSCAGTIETSRTDGLAGQRQVFTITDTGGTNGDKATLAYFGNINSSVSAGDQIFLEGDLDLSNLNQVEDVGCQLYEGNTVVQTVGSTFSGNLTGYNATWPSLTSATIAKWNEAKTLPDFGQTAAGSFRMHFRTPPLTVRASDTSWITQCVIYLNGSTGSATATVKASNFAIRKLNAT